MTRELRVHDDVAPELRAAYEWYEAKLPGLGDQFLDEVDRQVARILTEPATAAPVPHVPSHLPVRRFLLKRFPFAVVFVALENEVTILAVQHLRRRPNYWRGRLS